MKKVILIIGVCFLAIILFRTLQNKEKIADSDLTVTVISHQETNYEINSNIVSALGDLPETKEAMEYIRQQFDPTITTRTNEYK